IVLSRRRDAAPWLLGCTVASVLVYSIYVGGDAWEWWGGSNRYISVAMPLLFALLATALNDAWVRLTGVPPARLRSAVVVGGIVVVTLVNVNLLRQVSSLKELALLDPPFMVPQSVESVRTARALERLVDPDATIAVAAAGTLPYFAGHTVIDMLGKNDVRI